MNEKGKIRIETTLDNKELIDGYKGISKETDKLIKQYDNKLSKIKKEQIQIDNLKAKYNQLVSGSKVPPSLTAMETQVKKTTSALDDLIIKKDDMQKSGVSADSFEMQDITEQITRLENQLGNLDIKMQDLRLNPATSQEATELATQIEYLENNLQESVKEAEELSDNIEESTKKDFSRLTSGIKGFADTLAKSVGGSVSKHFDTLNSKIDKFKNKMTRLALTAMVFRLLRSSLTSLSNGITGMLKSNETFASSLNQIKANLMTAFAPIYNFILPAINALMNAISVVTGTIAQFTSSLFGKSLDESKAMAKSLDKQAKSYGKVAKAKKEAEERTASFDKLEVISEDSSSSGGGAGDSGIDFSGATQSSEELLGFLNQIKDLIASGEWFELGGMLAEGFNSAMKKIDVKGLFEKVKKGIKDISLFINGFVDKFDWGLLAQKISEGIRGLLQSITVFLQTVDWQAVGNAIGEFLLGIDWGGIALDLLNALISAMLATLDIVSGFLDALADKLADPNLLTDIFNFGVELLVSLVQGLLSVLGKIKEIIEKILGIFGQLLGVENIWQAISDFAKTCVHIITDIISHLVDFIRSCFDVILSIFGTLFGWFVDYVVNPIVNVFKKAWDILISGAKGAWDGIKNVFSSVANFFGNIFGAAWQKVKDIFSTGGQIFMGIVDGIVSAFKAIVNAIIGGINKVVAVPFNAINGVLNFIKDIDLPIVGMPFYGFWDYDPIYVPQIPLLAKGAVIPPNSEFAAILGDQKHGKNLEAPESLIRQIVKEESGDKEVTLNATFVVQCDDIEMARASLQGIRLMEEMNNTQYLVQ